MYCCGEHQRACVVPISMPRHAQDSFTISLLYTIGYGGRKSFSLTIEILIEDQMILDIALIEQDSQSIPFSHNTTDKPFSITVTNGGRCFLGQPHF